MAAHSGKRHASGKAHPASGFRRRPEHIFYGRVLGNIQGGAPAFVLQLRIGALRQQHCDNVCVPELRCNDKGGCTIVKLRIECRALCQQRFDDRAMTTG